MTYHMNILHGRCQHAWKLTMYEYFTRSRTCCISSSSLRVLTWKCQGYSPWSLLIPYIHCLDNLFSYFNQMNRHMRCLLRQRKNVNFEDLNILQTMTKQVFWKHDKYTYICNKIRSLFTQAFCLSIKKKDSFITLNVYICKFILLPAFC